MELNDLLAETAKVTVTYKKYVFKAEIFTERLTPAYKARLIALSSVNEENEGKENVDNEVKDENAQMLSDLIASWTDDKDEPIVLGGQPYPPTYENFLGLSYPLMAAFIKQITTFLGDQANPTNETSSPNS